MRCLCECDLHAAVVGECDRCVIDSVEWPDRDIRLEVVEGVVRSSDRCVADCHRCESGDEIVGGTHVEHRDGVTGLGHGASRMEPGIATADDEHPIEVCAAVRAAVRAAV